MQFPLPDLHSSPPLLPPPLLIKNPVRRSNNFTKERSNSHRLLNSLPDSIFLMSCFEENFISLNSDSQFRLSVCVLVLLSFLSSQTRCHKASLWPVGTNGESYLNSQVCWARKILQTVCGHRCSFLRSHDNEWSYDAPPSHSARLLTESVECCIFPGGHYS